MGQGWFDLLSQLWVSCSASLKQQNHTPIIWITLKEQHTEMDFGMQGLCASIPIYFSRSTFGWAGLSVGPACWSAVPARPSPASNGDCRFATIA
tara:strand:+ start:3103 stop:3384 length:282 start_codon:yes stop_codon:yes gene_type:complete